MEIVNPQLRRWIGLKPGQERHYDLQVALTHDPITLLHIYTIVQVSAGCPFQGTCALEGPAAPVGVAPVCCGTCRLWAM